MTNYDSWNIAILLGTGTGAFSDALFYPVSGGPSFVAICDVDEDGHQDLAVGCSDYDVSVLLGSGSFSGASSYGVGGIQSSIAIADCDEDGHQNLIVMINYIDVHLAILLGNGTGTFSDASLLWRGKGCTISSYRRL